MKKIEQLKKDIKFNLRNLEELEKIEIENFEEHSDLKRRLKIHVLNKYQNKAVFDDDSLIKEFNLLKENNDLKFLFEEEGEY